MVRNSPKTRCFPLCWLAQALPALVITLTISTMFGGCTTQVVRREAPSLQAFGGDQGGASEVIFTTPELSAALESDPTLASGDQSRRDYTLNIRDEQPLLATAEWPQRARASLERPRYVHFRDRDGRLTFFVPDRRDTRHYQHWHYPYQ